MMAQYRLLAATEIDGNILPAGAVVERPDDWVGPQRTVLPVHETIYPGKSTKAATEPLYVKLDG